MPIEYGRANHLKTLRMCSQAADALALALPECADETLQSLTVLSVAPAPNASRLLVTLGAQPPVDLADILGRLERARGFLRGQLAATITRKKTPELIFRIYSGE